MHAIEIYMFHVPYCKMKFSHIYVFCAVAVESEEQYRQRFQVELEFVQCLANPNYLHCTYLLIIFNSHQLTTHNRMLIAQSSPSADTSRTLPSSTT